MLEDEVGSMVSPSLRATASLSQQPRKPQSPLVHLSASLSLKKRCCVERKYSSDVHCSLQSLRQKSECVSGSASRAGQAARRRATRARHGRKREIFNRVIEKKRKKDRCSDERDNDERAAHCADAEPVVWHKRH